MPTEMQSNQKKNGTARPVSELDPQSLAAIRGLLEAEPPVTAQPVAERQAEQAARGMPDDTPPTRREQPVPSRTAEQVASPVNKPAKATTTSGIKSSLTSYRPTPKHIALAGFALLVLFRPWLVVGLLFLSLFVMVGVFLILGYDGFWRRAMGLARWYAKRRPSRAAELHRKLDNFAMKWDAILDRFPEGSVDGLYLPDFGDLATADARHDKALDRRFADMQSSDA
ncbi:hypothetical protein Z945_3868 [Sulfitobacter noctilucae]|uniref:hypothetical protein n=1 Tax=Sulfitobacter noctilucae TaxID=1342302 RepID=UPI00046A178C|nr:hypothetical protein [Sulfitobacter noctilucae]KIN66448.1 hypothetical protein Z945_3868 [Sulfitobacter noctilucae]